MDIEDTNPAAPRPHQRPLSVVMIDVGGRKYPMRTVSQCRTCMSPYRMEIEQAILEQHGYMTIANALVGRESGRLPNPGHQSIRDHVLKNHMPLGPTAERALVEERAKQIGRDIETHTAGLADYASVNQIIVQRGMDRLARGELQPTMSELLTAIRMQHAIESTTEDGLDAAAWQEALVAYMEVAAQFIPQENLHAYGQALTRNPVLKAMMTGGQRRPEPKALETAPFEA
jgi:hypothetical protein